QAGKDAGRRLAVHVKVDTGMTRLGFTPSAVGEAAARLAESGRIEVEGLMTHLAAADEDADATRRQLDLFDEAADELARRGIRPSGARRGGWEGLRTGTAARTRGGQPGAGGGAWAGVGGPGGGGGHARTPRATAGGDARAGAGPRRPLVQAA